MIRLLTAEASCKGATFDSLRNALQTAFPDVELRQDAVAMTDPDEPAWDDVLVVAHNGRPMDAAVAGFVQSYLRARAWTGSDGKTVDESSVVPVALDATKPVPPPPIGGLKSAVTSVPAEPWTSVVNTLQVHFGLALRHRDHQVFLSYRVSDGSAPVTSLHDGLKTRGFRPFLDAADDNVPPGADIQAVIDQHIQGASAIVFLDTPDAASSRWIRHEIDRALALSLPVLAIAFGPGRRPSFIALQMLRRAELMPDAFQSRALQEPEVGEVIGQLEGLLSHTYRRGAELGSRARRIYERHGWQWKQYGGLRRTYEAQRAATDVAAQHAINHCAIVDPRQAPIVRSFAGISGPTSFQHRVMLYGDQPLTRAQIDELRQSEATSRSVTFAHIGQLDTLVSSNFSTLGAP